MKKYILLCFCVSLLSTFGLSQRVNTNLLPAEWTLQYCIDYAYKNNIQLNSLRLTGSIVKQDLLQSEFNQLPNLGGSFSQAWIHRKDVTGIEAPASFSSNYGVNSSVILYNGGYLKNTIKANQLLLQSANLSIEQAVNDITLAITQAYLNILLVKENISLLREVLTTSQAQLVQGQQRYEGGSISKKSLLQLQSQIASDSFNLVNAQNNYRLNLVALKQLLQLPATYELQIVTPQQLNPEEEAMSLQDAQNKALDNRAEVKNKEVGVRLAQVDKELAKANFLPSFNITGGMYSAYTNNTGTKYFPGLNNNFYQTISLGATIPIFNRHQNKTNITKSEIAIEQSNLALDETKINLSQQVEQAYINMLNSQAEYRAAEEQLKAAEEIYNITNEQLKYGAINMVEVLQQKNAYVLALEAFVQSKYRAVLFNKIYQFYAGQPITF